MAESQNLSQGSVTLKFLKRALSLKTRKGNEEAATDDRAFNTSPTSPDTQKSPTKENVFKIANIRSFGKKPIHEIFQSKEDASTTSDITEKETTNNCDFTYNSLPSTPLSVMEINNLIQKKALKEAYLNILALQNEVQREQKAEASSVNLANQKTDLTLLYNNLRDKLVEIIHQSCSKPSCDKELLVLVAGIIEDKEKREGNVDEMKGWRDVWQITIQQGVKETLGKMNSNEQKVDCKEHLERLGKNIVDLLETVKVEILNLYPPSFRVFRTYASSCHEFVGEHLKVLLGNITELKDYDAMQDFVFNRYHSEMILNSSSLQPEMKDLKSFTLSVDLLGQIKKAYCDCMQETLHALLGDIIKAEQEQVWKTKVPPKRTEDGIIIISEVNTGVCEFIRKYSDDCAKLDENLEKMAIFKCMETLKQFPKRFVEEFSKQCQPLLSSDLLDSCLWAEYHIYYINTFISLKENIEGYRNKCPEQVGELVSELEGLIDRLRQALLDQFINEIEPFLDRLMTKDWLNTDTDFNDVVNRIETYSGYKKSMKPVPAQSFANDVHYNVVKRYISELLKNKYSCKGKKNDVAAAKINEQWIALKTLFCEMGSSLDWLHSLGYHISEIIQQEHEKNMKNALTALIEKYPDISKKQLSAILYFRDSSFKFERSPAIQCFTELKRKIDNEDKNGNHTFFSDIK